MIPAACIQCDGYPCIGVNSDGYCLPMIDVEPQLVRVMLISEAAPAQREDYYDSPGDPLFLQTTLAAFNDAGIPVRTLADLLDLGVYLTTAVKCSKNGYTVPSPAIETCSYLLAQELALFPNVQAYLLMGDVAIKAINYVARRNGQARVIPPGATYKIRGGQFYFQGRRAFPSYVQAGPAFFVEKVKRKMIAEDIAAAMALVQPA